MSTEVKVRKAIIGALLIFACSLIQAQISDESLKFEAASVKPATPPKGMIPMPSGGPGTKDPGRVHYPYMSLKYLLMAAYDVKVFQVSGPAWLDTERFEIDATMAPGTTKEQFRVMLQNLLAERFKLAVHRESTQLPMYALVVAKNGPKIKESAAAPAFQSDDGPLPASMPMRPKIGADGFPVLPPRPPGLPIGVIMMNGRARLDAQFNTMQELAELLTSVTSRPVVDATGLKAEYDFTLTYLPEEAPPPTPSSGGRSPIVPEADALPDIFEAVQAQLGLKLEPKRGPVEMIVVDRGEKTPTGN
jgi:uncharacterized protein (TIGR03435 family)